MTYGKQRVAAVTKMVTREWRMEGTCGWEREALLVF